MGLFDLDIDIAKVRKVVDLVWDNKDELIDLLTRLPSLLGDAGEQMHTAGEGAQQASNLLSGDLLTLTAAAADALDASQKQLATVAGVLAEIGKAIDRVPLMSSVTDPVSRGLKAVGEVADNLDTVAVQVRGIGASLDSVGDGLDAMGGSLKGGGQALAALSGRKVGTPAKPGPKAAPKGGAKPAPKAAPKATPKAAPKSAPTAAPKKKPTTPRGPIVPGPRKGSR